MNESVSLELLDNDLRHVIQSWKIETSVCQIGRSTESDIVIRNPFVSRSHAYLTKESGEWKLNSISKLGFLIDGRVETSVKIDSELEFRLSRKGPLLRIRIQNQAVTTAETKKADSMDAMQTICENDFDFPMLILDQQKRDEEVAEITSQNYFNRLQEIASNLKNQNRQANN